MLERRETLNFKVIARFLPDVMRNVETFTSSNIRIEKFRNPCR